MLKNELLRKAYEHVQSTAKDQDMFQRLVKAGMRIIYDQKVFQKLVTQLANSKDPAADVGRGMVLVLKLLSDRTRGTAPAPVLIQAGMALVLDALDFLEQSGALKVDAKTLDHATEEYVEAVLPATGVSTNQMAQTLTQVKQVMSDPQKMAAYRQSLGSAAQ